MSEPIEIVEDREPNAGALVWRKEDGSHGLIIGNVNYSNVVSEVLIAIEAGGSGGRYGIQRPRLTITLALDDIEYRKPTSL
ncbi:MULTISPECIES: hypothetical protein [unclassified Luteococcus]|uniref:hypothetical protein n=1 Tax=unclassified Luteococcus TaxID=2639923 RepID=UPI00313ECA6C